MRPPRLGALLFAVLTLARAESVTYQYDHLNRLTKAEYGGGRTITYTYDPNGNLLNRTVTGAAPPAVATGGVANAAGYQTSAV